MEPLRHGGPGGHDAAGTSRQAEFFIDVDGRITIRSGRSVGPLADSLNTGVVRNAGFSVVRQEAHFATIVFSPRLITAANFNAIAQILDWSNPRQVLAICQGQAESWETFDYHLGALCWIELVLAAQGMIEVSDEHAVTLVQALEPCGYLGMKRGECALGRLRLETGWGANLERNGSFG